jgi:hypothetical protein
MRHDDTDLEIKRYDQDRYGFAPDAAELSDEDLGQVSGGCRKAGGEQESAARGYQPIIAI